MASPNTNWSEISTTALKYRAPKIFDQTSKSLGLLNRLRSKGNIKRIDGGESIVVPLEYATNGSYKRYSGYEFLNIDPQDVFTAAEYNWKQAAISVTISGLEQLQNSGANRQFALLKSRMANAERSFKLNFGADCYSDGTADGGRQVGGLQLLVADAPTNTVGGISGQTWSSFWQNSVIDASGHALGAVTKSNIQSYMNQMWLALSGDGEEPDLILADNNYYTAYWEALQAIQRITESKMASAGFNALKFKNADVIYDGGRGGSCPTDHMYFLNTEYIQLHVHKDRDMTPLDADRYATNQDAMVKLIGFAGNVVCSNRRAQGVLKA